MGFSKAQAMHALGETGGDAERAADWLFNHPDFIPPEEGEGDGKEEEEEEEEEEEPGKIPLYELFGVVQHRGTSIGSGHYVAYMRAGIFFCFLLFVFPCFSSRLFSIVGGADGGWVQFNDSKVTESLTPPLGQGYMYFFMRK